MVLFQPRLPLRRVLERNDFRPIVRHRASVRSRPTRHDVRVSAGDDRIVDNKAEHRYELWRGSTLAGHIDYRDEPGAIVLIHTEVDPQFEGHGLGSALVRGALDDIRARGLRLVPVCPFVRTYLERHPEDRELTRPRE
jgi:uncharacterized protein